MNTEERLNCILKSLVNRVYDDVEFSGFGGIELLNTHIEEAKMKIRPLLKVNKVTKQEAL